MAVIICPTIRPKDSWYPPSLSSANSLFERPMSNLIVRAMWKSWKDLLVNGMGWRRQLKTTPLKIRKCIPISRWELNITTGNIQEWKATTCRLLSSLKRKMYFACFSYFTFCRPNICVCKYYTYLNYCVSYTIFLNTNIFLLGKIIKDNR